MFFYSDGPWGAPDFSGPNEFAVFFNFGVSLLNESAVAAKLATVVGFSRFGVAFPSVSFPAKGLFRFGIEETISGDKLSHRFRDSRVGETNHCSSFILLGQFLRQV